MSDVLTTFAGSGESGFVNGSGSQSSFKNPYGIVFDGKKTFYVSDQGNNVIRKIEIIDNHTYQEIFRGSTQHTVTSNIPSSES